MTKPDLPQIIDHGVHGLATIRLIDAPRQIVDEVVKEIGPSQGVLSDKPDICVTFTDHIDGSGTLRFLELNNAAFAFDNENFYLLDSRGHRTKVDFDRLGERCELVCERGVTEIPVPLLVSMLGLQLLRKGYVLLHSSSFVHEGKGILVAGWQTGGKTEMLLSFMTAGAYYMTDEWTIVSGSDGTLRGLSADVAIWSWQFRYLPGYWARIKGSDRRRIQLARWMKRLWQIMPHRLHGGKLLPLVYRLGLKYLEQARTSPQALFGDHIWQGSANLDRVFLANVVQDQICVSPIASQEIAHRMVASLAYERRYLLAAYNQFRFAFPDRNNELLETAGERERQLLLQALANKPAYEVCHPYPLPLPDLHKAAVPFC